MDIPVDPLLKILNLTEKSKKYQKTDFSSWCYFYFSFKVNKLNCSSFSCHWGSHHKYFIFFSSVQQLLSLLKKEETLNSRTYLCPKTKLTHKTNAGVIQLSRHSTFAFNSEKCWQINVFVLFWIGQRRMESLFLWYRYIFGFKLKLHATNWHKNLAIRRISDTKKAMGRRNQLSRFYCLLSQKVFERRGVMYNATSAWTFNIFSIFQTFFFVNNYTFVHPSSSAINRLNASLFWKIFCIYFLNLINVWDLMTDLADVQFRIVHSRIPSALYHPFFFAVGNVSLERALRWKNVKDVFTQVRLLELLRFYISESSTALIANSCLAFSLSNLLIVLTLSFLSFFRRVLWRWG